MAAAPSFAATPVVGSAVVSATADVSYTAPANAVNVLSAPGAPGLGYKVDEITLIGTGTTVAGEITLFLFDGTNYHLYDAIAVPAIAPSTTVAPWRTVRPYPSLVLPPGWSLRAASTVANQLVNVVAIGGAF